MRKVYGWVLFLTIGLHLGSVATSTAQETERGANLFHQYCATCHGEKANGNGPMAPYLTVKPSDLTTITQRQRGEFPEEQIKRIIAGEENPPGHGTRTMPVWGERLQDDLVGGASKPTVARGRIAFLVDYLKSIQDAKQQPFENVVTPTGGLRPEDKPRQ